MHNLSIRPILLIVACALISACSTHYGAAKIVSNPPGAEVSLEDGTIVGITPTTAWWKDSSSRRKNVILQFEKDGYYKKVTPFWLSMRHKSLEKAQANTQLVEVVLDNRGGQ
jgi:predicted small secreted protein